MQAVVTVIGAYKGVPAFEYEIRDDAARPQAYDIVIVHPHAGETWADLAAIVREHIRVRAAEWELSDTVEKRMRRAESVAGGVRLERADGGSTDAPEIEGRRPSASDRVAVQVTRSEAQDIVRGRSL